jgi:hypothetical protein
VCVGQIEYEEQMEEELADTTMAESFVRAPSDKKSNDNHNNNDDAMDDAAPVDVNMNLVKNLLESFSMQQGQAGPTTTLLDALKSQTSSIVDKKQ